MLPTRRSARAAANAAAAAAAEAAAIAAERAEERRLNAINVTVDALPDEPVFSETFNAVVQYMQDQPGSFVREHDHETAVGRVAYEVAFQSFNAVFPDGFPHGQDISTRVAYWAGLTYMYMNARYRGGPRFPLPISLLAIQAERITGVDIVYETGGTNGWVPEMEEEDEDDDTVDEDYEDEAVEGEDAKEDAVEEKAAEGEVAKE